MLTPLDIENKEFNKELRGYNKEEVNGFLDQVIQNYKNMYKNNAELKKRIDLLNSKVSQYEQLERTLQKALIVAENAAEELRENAQKKAELIVQEAENKSSKIINEAYDEVKTIQDEYEILKKEILIFKARFKTFLSAELEALEEYKLDNINHKFSKDKNKV